MRLLHALVFAPVAFLLFSFCATNTFANGPHSPLLTQPPPQPGGTKIALIIDDIGYSWSQGKAATTLPGPVTLAIIPHSPYGAKLAEAGHREGKEIMLHAPMSNVLNKPLDAGALTEDMPYAMFMRTLHEDLAAVPHVRGINNHMGSRLTQQTKPMRWLMQAIQGSDLYFIDSRTSASSVAWQVAKEERVPTLRRDYFLDNEVNYASIAMQLGRFLKMAKRNGQGVAIAHPHPETIQVLRAALPLLESSGIRLVPVSDLLSPTQHNSGNSQMSSNVTFDGPRDYKTPFLSR